MAFVTRVARRLLPALLMASSVTLLTAGIFNWAPPQTLGDIAFATPSPDTGDPSIEGTPQPTQIGPGNSQSPATTPNASDCFLPGSTPCAGPSGSPTPTPSTNAGGDSPPTRVVVPSLGIDLPVVPGNSDYPLCNVAQYLAGFANPGIAGTTYMYGHARTSMFLPLLEESEQNDGAGMIGALVKVYTADEKLHMYQIDIVKRHATDLSLAFELDRGQHRLILQTSEGPRNTIPKLQVAASPIGIYPATAAEALPEAHPQVCG